jgi:ADP-dependent NAD(P)H-hydrate dehydratase / NAD(P)H-hydrate epimerase
VKIFSAAQFRAWDLYTIANEPVNSIDLMERAALKCCEWICTEDFPGKQFKVFCGIGNNGGDGLAIARLLFEKNIRAEVYVVETRIKGSTDFEINLKRLRENNFTFHTIQSEQDFPLIESSDVLIDALFGTGLNKPPEGIFARLIEHINGTSTTVISIDLPSGVYADKSSVLNTVVHASYTLTFQAMKLSLLVAENATFIGEVHIIDIGLDKIFYQNEKAAYYLTEAEDVKKILHNRNRFAHKGNFGHALLVAGSYGKMGAAVLAAKACVHSGSGLLTCHIPQCGYEIMQTAVPEAMVNVDSGINNLKSIPGDFQKYNAIGIGPGIGMEKPTRDLVETVLKKYTGPLILDADALNCIAADKKLLQLIPPLSILTPHPKEFDRVFGEHENEFDRIAKAISTSVQHNIIIVLKGHHSLVATPNGAFFNSTGNSGMAKGGSGDVLTGLLTSLLAQKYTPEQACILGCYLHGLAGNQAADALTQEYMTASSIVNFLPQAFRLLKEKC